MESNNFQAIRKHRQNLRKNIKCQLKLPNISHKISINTTQISLVQKKKQKIHDTREFKNIGNNLKIYLGQGASGVVKKCKQIKTGEVYAVKIIKGDEQFIRITKRTYQILKLFDNPSIIKAKCLFIDERIDKIYLVMEYCKYPSLAQVIKQNNLTIAQCKKIIKKILQAVAQLHSKDVCHRDLKPANILYDKEKNQIKIIDFGISKITYNKKRELKQKMWTVTGTIHYKAPQMFIGGQYDQMIDMWAIGVITYELVYKNLPFNSQYNTQIIDQITQKQPLYDEFDDQQSPLTIDFIKALLKKNKNQRINCSTALRHPWIENSQNKNNNKKFTSSQDCFSSQFFFNRQRKNTHLQKIEKANSGSMTFFELDTVQNQINSKKQKQIWKKFQKDNDILEIPKQNDQFNWVSLKRGISKDEFLNQFNELKQLQQADQLN